MKILVFLTETRLELKNLEFLRRKLGMYRSWGVERSGTRGGLAILWKEEIQVTVQSSSVAHIDATFRVIGITGWHFIGFYGHPETAKRGDSWILLKRLQQYDDMPWLVVVVDDEQCLWCFWAIQVLASKSNLMRAEDELISWSKGETLTWEECWEGVGHTWGVRGRI